MVGKGKEIKMFNRELGIYINNAIVKYIVLDDGREIKIKDIKADEYQALKEWGVIVREFYK